MATSVACSRMARDECFSTKTILGASLDHIRPAESIAQSTEWNCKEQIFNNTMNVRNPQVNLALYPQVSGAIGLGGPRPVHFLALVGRLYLWPAHFKHYVLR